jgi:hypothetical protein
VDVAKAIRKMIAERGVKQKDVAEKIYPTTNGKVTFNYALSKNGFRLKDLPRIADAFDYDVKLQFIDRRSGEIIEVKPSLGAQEDAEGNNN